jgi:hypothetical protein
MGMTAIAALCGLLAGCAGSGYDYVKSSSNRTYFKVPDSWKLYDQDAVLKANPNKLSADELAQQRTSTWQEVFDASPNPSITHLGSPTAKYPVGQAIVETLSPDEADTISLQSLRNMFVGVDDALNNNQAVVLGYEPVQRDGGFHGVKLTARLALTNGSVTFSQIAMVDAATSKRYSLFVACTSACYTKNQKRIAQVLDSWTVKGP